MRLRELREQHRYYQQDVADFLGVQRQVYRRYETEEREIPIHLAIKLGKLYGCSLDYLVGISNKKGKMV